MATLLATTGPVTRAMAAMRNDLDQPRRGFLATALALPLLTVAGPSALALACDAAVARLIWVNTNDEPASLWPDERVSEENCRFDDVLDRIVEEPARDLNDLAAKARLLAYEWRQSVGTDTAGQNAGERALGAFLREVAALAA